MLLGSMLAGMAFANAPVAAVHALAYPIGAIFHVPHGLSNALVLLGVCGSIYPTPSRSTPSSPLFSIPPAAGTPTTAAAAALCGKFGWYLPGLRRPASLSEVGVDQKDLPRLAEDAMKQTRLLVNNPREVACTDALAIYSEALNGKQRGAA